MSEMMRGRAPFLVLLSLKSGAKHGYEMATFINDKGNGHFGISYGSLYPILHRLEKDGLIVGSWTEIGNAKSKKVYALTANGRRALEEEVADYRTFMSVMSNLLEVAK